MNEIREPGLVDRRLPCIERINRFNADVDARDLVTCAGEHRRERRTEPAESGDRNMHD